MRRFPEDAELGFPKYHLRGTDILLMKKCIICENLDHDDDSDQSYYWLNYDPFTITSVELKEPEDEIPRKIATLGDINFKLAITVIYGFVLLIFHELSIYPNDLIPWGNDVFLSLSFLIILLFAGWDYLLYQQLTEKLELSHVINLSMKGKIAPERLENDNKMNSKEYFYHFLIIVARATFVIGALVMTTQVEFLEGIYFLARIFLIFVLMTITIPVVFFLAFLPVNLSRYRRYYSSDYRKTPSLEIRDFHSRLFYEWNSARENYQTPLAELITGKETPDVEYKASYWTELDDAKKKNLLLQDSVIKVVAGLMNSKKGGHVIIGIQDNTKEPTGLVDEDISQLSKDPSWDQLERHIVNTLENNLSSASSILPNEAYVLKEERWPQNEEGERIILIYIPQQANTPVYALQKATQKIKLRKWREKHAKMSESERYPKAFVPEHLKGDFKFRFLRKQTSTKHQNQEDWDKHWHDL